LPAGEAVDSAIVQGRRRVWWCGGTLFPAHVPCDRQQPALSPQMWVMLRDLMPREAQPSFRHWNRDSANEPQRSFAVWSCSLLSCPCAGPLRTCAFPHLYGGMEETSIAGELLEVFLLEFKSLPLPEECGVRT